MGAGGMYPNYPYSDDYMGYNRPYYNRGGYPFPGRMPPYSGYPPNYGMGGGGVFGRPFQRPYPSTMDPFSSIMNGFGQGMFSNQIGGRGLFDLTRSAPPTTGGGGGLQSAPPSQAPNGNLQLNRPGSHRPHFDEQ